MLDGAAQLLLEHPSGARVTVHLPMGLSQAGLTLGALGDLGYELAPGHAEPATVEPRLGAADRRMIADALRELWAHIRAPQKERLTRLHADACLIGAAYIRPTEEVDDGR